MLALDALPPTAASQPTAFSRIHAALATTSVEQTGLAIAAAAHCLRACVGEAPFLRLAARLDDDLKPAFLATVETSDGDLGEAGASLVMAVAARLPGRFPAHACLVVRVVLAELSRQVGPDTAQRLLCDMPDRMRKLWPASVWKGSDAAHAA